MTGIEKIRQMREENQKKPKEERLKVYDLFHGMVFYSWGNYEVLKYQVIGKAPHCQTTHTIMVSNMRTGRVENLSWKSIIFPDSPACLFLDKTDLFKVCIEYHESKIRMYNNLIEINEKEEKGGK